MFLLTYILDFLLKGQSPCSFSILLKLLGYFLIIIAIGLASYFVFHLLIPVVGYEMSGLSVCGLVACLGSLFLIIGHRKKLLDPVDSLVSNLHNFATSKIIRGHALNIVLFTLFLGFLFSHLISPKEKEKNEKTDI